MIFDRNFFIKQRFKPEELEKYKKSALRNLGIARSGREPEVIFHFAYMALIKTGIYCLAKAGYRIKAKPGHHQKIIEYLSKALDTEDIAIIGDKMRNDRNLDMYGAETEYSDREIQEYLKFIETVYEKAQREK